MQLEGRAWMDGPGLIAQDETAILSSPADLMFSVITVGMEEFKWVLKIISSLMLLPAVIHSVNSFLFQHSRLH